MEVGKSKSFYPTKNQLIIAGFAWIVGVFILLASMTDFFSESLKNRQLTILGMLTSLSLVAVLVIWSNYPRRQKS
ncbi:hypothetical protein SAMN04489724_2330 [Algoriphagus locisalis]|uniref:Uncharacterized protein n=1 Tax=Algoriphagus locisalis TaxID=305507 RepID=A0A1I7BE95_9BACT|nr:hypothetical protein [Algoriphagus locisalis]SFT85431.1 hypothetical protein SAMN04489724_2330 [Algoriphagus locisalis]